MAVVIVSVLHTKTTDAASLVPGHPVIGTVVRQTTVAPMPLFPPFVNEGTAGTGTGSVSGGKEDSKGSITTPIGR